MASDLCALLRLKRFLPSASLGPLRAQMRSGEIVWHLMQQNFEGITQAPESGKGMCCCNDLSWNRLCLDTLKGLSFVSDRIPSEKRGSLHD